MKNYTKNEAKEWAYMGCEQTENNIKIISKREPRNYPSCLTNISAGIARNHWRDVNKFVKSGVKPEFVKKIHNISKR